MLRRLSAAFLVMSFLASAQLSCDSKSKSKSKSSESDEDEDDGKKKKGKGSAEASGEASGKASAPPGVEVPGIPGFVVPVGGKYEHQKIELGEKVLEFENYTYPLKDFDRPGLKKSFKETLTAAGWAVAPEAGSDTKFTVTKGTSSVDVVFGEAGSDETKLNVMPPRTVAGGATPPDPGTAAAPAGDTPLFAGTYSSMYGPVTFEQSKAEPLKVNGRYRRGTINCTATGPKLDCGWAEPGYLGRAIFNRQTDGNMTGTWGNGTKATGAGAWDLKLTKAGELK